MIRVSHLTKYYGDYRAVDDLSFTIEDGHVYGFLGPNGAGKSTTMNIITGCLSPTDGTVTIGDYDILEQPEEAKKQIGYLPELPPLYVSETPQEYLEFVGEAKGLRGKALKAQINEVVKCTGIENVRDSLIDTLSKGYRQRVGIAQALLGDPKVIILDEPTVGLDPLQIIEIRDLIKELGKTHTVIFSSHILSEVQAVCEQVLIISKGKLVAFDTPENLEKLMMASRSVSFQVEASRATAQELLEQQPELADWTIHEKDGICSVTVQLTEDADAKAVCGKLTLAFAAKGLPVIEMRVNKANLEDVFLELTETDVPVAMTTAPTDTSSDTAVTGGEGPSGAASEPITEAAPNDGTSQAGDTPSTVMEAQTSNAAQANVGSQTGDIPQDSPSGKESEVDKQ